MNQIRYRYFRNNKVSMFLGRNTIGKMMLHDIDQPGAYISHLSVTPMYQNKGYGTKFMHEVIRFCKDTGCTALSLKCLVSNQDALRFYKRLGFFIAVTYDTDPKKDRQYLLTRKL